MWILSFEPDLQQMGNHLGSDPGTSLTTNLAKTILNESPNITERGHKVFIKINNMNKLKMEKHEWLSL